MSVVVEVHGLRVVYEARAVLDVPALDVRQGELIAIIGPNGAGKSTLLRVLGLLETPAAGEVRFRGTRVNARAGLALRRRMASVFQDPLLADTTVYDNVALGLRFRGVNGRDIEQRVGPWLDRFGIAALASRQARTLSGGEAQRTALARALVVEPELLLLDEPFAALDQPTRDGLINDLGRILGEEQTTSVFVTHDRAEAMILGDRVGVLMGGRLLQIDEASQVFRAPASEEIARFVGVETILDCRVLESAGDLSIIEAGGQRIEVAQPAEAGEWVRLCVRPEDVTLFPGSPKPAGSSAFNRLPARVQRIVAAGPHVRVIVDCGFPLVALVTRRSVEDLGLRDGVIVTAHFKSTAAHLLRHGKP
ncbi:MAG TPA: ABC transporter ATP-binding protein [Methylomirabilota bacterium]|jgi:tungstate transport system ATP-binding protein|nr:ABC transporter ATP-binding protein [Methylomirabilota bacterium]